MYMPHSGILYINPGDLGWNPYVTSWVETRESQAEKASLTILGGHSNVQVASHKDAFLSRSEV